MSRAIVTALLLAAYVGTAACVGTETGNPYTEMGAFGSTEPMGIAPEPLVGFAGLGLDRVTFLGGEGCDEELVAFEGATAVELLGAGEPIALELQAGEWCEVVVGLRPVAFDGVEGEHALRVTGELLDGATLVASLGVPVEARLTAPGGAFELDEGDGVHFVLDLGRLFATASLGTAPRDGMNQVIVDEGADPERAVALGESLAPALRVLRDVDGDGVLDPEELDGPTLAGAEG
jgi:hypothetical protein